jgi:hypothetical protein
MAARGSTAKSNVINKIAMAFGTDYVGEYDKKVYVYADDGGERVQIAIALTCPKNPVGAPEGASAMDHSDWDFESFSAPQPTEKATITEDEEKKIAEVAALMERLGL